jgi:hypothetical protein
MKTNSLSALRALFCCVFFFGIFGNGWGQNSFNSGDGWGAGWGNGSAMSSSAGTSLIYTATNTSGTGDRYFRFYGTGTPCGQYGPQNSSVQLSTNTVYTSSTLTCGNNTYAYYLSVANTTDNWIFKSASPTAQKMIIFRVQGAVRSISALTQPSSTVVPGGTATVSVTLDGALATGARTTSIISATYPLATDATVTLTYKAKEVLMKENVKKGQVKVGGLEKQVADLKAEMAKLIDNPEMRGELSNYTAKLEKAEQVLEKLKVALEKSSPKKEKKEKKDDE